MTINYLPNDPLAQSDAPLRTHTPRPDRPSNRAGFTYNDLADEGRHPIDSPEFLFWQCSEAALAAVEVFERLDGPLGKWAVSQRLDIQQDMGEDLNAYYDRGSLAFFHWQTGNKATFSGQSTDVVAHEAGHALLDAMRPDLWSSFLPEVNAFHEAFGDCMALLTALDDRPSRERLIAKVPSLWGENFIEATAEDLSDGIRRALGASHPAAAPRHAFNWFEWQIPSSLPTNGPPSVLTSEIHSFARVFSGCFYDLVGNLWNGQPSWSQQALKTAADTAGRLLLAGARAAQETPRFFQSVGRAMVLADQQLNGGTNGKAIHDAFEFHNVALGSAAMLAPTAALEGPAPRAAATARPLAAATRKDILNRLGEDARQGLEVKSVVLGGQTLVSAIHQRAVELGKLDKRLAGTVAMAAEPTLVGESGGRAAVLGALPSPLATEEEVETFVRTLLEHGRIAFTKEEKQRRSVRALSSVRETLPTHEVKMVRGKKELVRIRFACPAIG